MAFARVSAIRVTALEDIPSNPFVRTVATGSFVCRGASSVPDGRVTAAADDGSGFFAAGSPVFISATAGVEIFAGTVREFPLDLTSDADAVKFGALRMAQWKFAGCSENFPEGSLLVELMSEGGNVVASYTSLGTNATQDLTIGGDYPILEDYIILPDDDGHRDLPSTVDAPYDHATTELWYRVETPPDGVSGTLTIDTTASGPSKDTFLGIWDGAGNLVASGTGAASGPSLISATVSGNSSYYVGVNSRANSVAAAAGWRFSRAPGVFGDYLADIVLDVSYTEGEPPLFWSVLRGTQEVV